MATVHSLQTGSVSAPLALRPNENEFSWYAVNTLAQNERSVVRCLDQFDVETFLPTCESLRRWKNRQTVRVIEALFPTYVFVRICRSQQGIVLRAPGVRRIVGSSRGPIALPSSEIDFLRSGEWREKIEAYREIAVGQRVRIRNGSMQGIEGMLVRKKNALRFVMTLELINLSAAVEVSAADIELIAA